MNDKIIEHKTVIVDKEGYNDINVISVKNNELFVNMGLGKELTLLMLIKAMEKIVKDEIQSSTD